MSTVGKEVEKGCYINLKQKSIYISTFFPKRLKTHLHLHEFVFGLLLELCYIVSFLFFFLNDLLYGLSYIAAKSPNEGHTKNY